MCFIMEVFIDEILLLIVNYASRAQLATLCRVSRKLHSICTPLLYRAPQLLDAEWRLCLDFLGTVSAHRVTVLSLYIGRDVYMSKPRAQTVFKDILKATKKCLEDLEELQIA